MSDHHGQFVWYELMTSDPAAAQAFYGAVIGWTAKDAGLPDRRYTILSAGDRAIAGLMALPPSAAAMGVPPCWMGYVGVADVDAAADRIASAGGSIHHPADDIPGVGRFAVVADPQGAPFQIFRGMGGEPPLPVAPGTPGHVGWHELYTTDLEAAAAFYADQFGWKKTEAMDMGPMGIYQMFATRDVSVGGMMTKPEMVPMSCWQYYVNVEAADAAVGRIQAGGGQVLMGPHQVPGGSWIVQCRDPQGAVFAIVAPAR
jgi:predicted enzyme related to lactoylglutathione lyase